MRPVDHIFPVGRYPERRPANHHWVWPNVVPRGCLVVLDGDPGTGKSLIVLDWAARLSRGTEWPDGSKGKEPGTAILFCGEDHRERTVQPRLAMRMADLERVYILGTPDDPDGMPSLPADLPWLDALFARVQPQLVVFDPLSLFLASADNPRKSVVGLSRLASRYDVAIVLVRHLVKKQYGRALYRGAGTIGIVGLARCCFLASLDPADPTRFVLAPAKFNVGVPPPTQAYRFGDLIGEAVIDWLGPAATTADDAARGARHVPVDRPGEVHAADWLTKRLGSGEQPAAELLAEAKAAGIRERTLNRAKSALQVKSRLLYDHGKRSWVWSLPDPRDDEFLPPTPAENIAGFMEDFGWTAADLASRTGFAEATIKDFVSGKKKMSDAQYALLEGAFTESGEQSSSGGCDGRDR